MKFTILISTEGIAGYCIVTGLKYQNNERCSFLVKKKNLRQTFHLVLFLKQLSHDRSLEYQLFKFSPTDSMLSAIHRLKFKRFTMAANFISKLNGPYTCTTVTDNRVKTEFTITSTVPIRWKRIK